MSYVIVAIIFAVVGFVIGALVFHNNESKGNALINTAQADAAKVETAANNVVSDIKKA